MALATLLLLHFLNFQGTLKTAAAYLVSVGGFFYPFVWLFAALRGPEIGRSAAKEKFILFGYMVGLFRIGLALSLFLTVKHDLKRA